VFQPARECGVVANLDFAEIMALSQQPVRLVALSDDSAAFIFACAAFYQSRFNWVVDGVPPTDTEWNAINRLIGKAEYELMNSLVGLIFPHGLGSIAGMPFLPCDGSVYNRTEYPILYAKLDPVYIIDVDTFRVPDMRDRMPIGAGSDFSIDEIGGEKEHVLTGVEMPEHTHDNAPHAHTEITAIPALGAAITGVPVPSATVSTGVTSFESISINPAGESQAHNNMPPYIGVFWAIVAG
jgi:microcystin-dependent protein